MSEKKIRVRVFRGEITPKIVEVVKGIEPVDGKVTFTVAKIREELEWDLKKMVENGHVKEISLNVEIAAILTELGMVIIGKAKRQAGEMGRSKNLFMLDMNQLTSLGKKMFEEEGA